MIAGDEQTPSTSSTEYSENNQDLISTVEKIKNIEFESVISEEDDDQLSILSDPTSFLEECKNWEYPSQPDAPEPPEPQYLRQECEAISPWQAKESVIQQMMSYDIMNVSQKSTQNNNMATKILPFLQNSNVSDSKSDQSNQVCSYFTSQHFLTLANDLKLEQKQFSEKGLFIPINIQPSNSFIEFVIGEESTNRVIKIIVIDQQYDSKKTNWFQASQIHSNINIIPEILNKFDNSKYFQALKLSLSEQNQLQVAQEIESPITLESISQYKQVIQEEWDQKELQIILYHILKEIIQLSKAKIYHRDIKDSNILYHPSSKGFILSNFLSSTHSPTGSINSILGTPYFMDPTLLNAYIEQCQQQNESDKNIEKEKMIEKTANEFNLLACDIYSVAITMLNLMETKLDRFKINLFLNTKVKDNYPLMVEILNKMVDLDNDKRIAAAQSYVEEFDMDSSFSLSQYQDFFEIWQKSLEDDGKEFNQGNINKFKDLWII